MEKTIFLEQMEGLMAEQVVRDHKYSMYAKHFHESYELYFLLQGERFYFIDHETYLVKTGMAALVSPNQIHQTSDADNSYHDRFLLQIDDKVFNPYLQALGLPSLATLVQETTHIVEYPTNDWNVIKQILEQLKNEWLDRRTGFESILKMLVIQLILLNQRNAKATSSHFQGKSLTAPPYHAQTAKHQKIREITQYLSEQSASKISQTELAAHFYVSKSYLCRIFKEVTGFTINEYQNLIRIKKAQVLLSQSKLPITEIAALAGFESITYFERVFKKYTDQRPLQYRKNNF